MGSQKVRHNLATEQQQENPKVIGKQRSREIKTAVGGNNEADTQREEMRMQEKFPLVIRVLGSRCFIGPGFIHKTSQSPIKFFILFKHIRNFSNVQSRT